MGLLGYTITKESELDKTAHAKVEAMETRYKGYTEHVAVINFFDQDTNEEIVFDLMKNKNNKVIFYEYTGITNASDTIQPRFKIKKIREVDYDDLKDIKITKRRPREMSYEEAVTRKKPVEQIEKGEKVLEVYYK